jgi:hypothetical protein
MKIEHTRMKLFARSQIGIAGDKEFVDWAIQELLEGNETESIKILAGLEPPLNCFEVKEYTERSKMELKLHFDENKIIDHYAQHLAAQRLNDEITSKEITEEMYRILQHMDCDKKYHAWFDLNEFFDDYYVISDKDINDVIIDECRRMLQR